MSDTEIAAITREHIAWCRKSGFVTAGDVLRALGWRRDGGWHGAERAVAGELRKLRRERKAPEEEGRG